MMPRIFSLIISVTIRKTHNISVTVNNRYAYVQGHT
jgi:hypothetical protein